MPDCGDEPRRPYQPYECRVCQSRFTRSENLKRHADVHTRVSERASLRCELCHATFSRPDLRSRHMKRKHVEHMTVSKPRRAKQTPIGSRDSTSPSSAEEDAGRSQDSYNMIDEQSHGGFSFESLPDGRVQRGSLGFQNAAAPNVQLGSWSETTSRSPGHPDSQLRAGPTLQSAPMNASVAGSSLTDSLAGWPYSQLSPAMENWLPSDSQIRRGVQLYFAHVSHFIPFIHQPTFEIDYANHFLILAMLCLGYQYGEDPESGDQVGTGAALSTRCFHQGRQILALDDDIVDSVTLNIARVQSYLMLEICAMLYLCGDDSIRGLRIHSRMISLARSSGLMQPIPSTSATHDLDSLWQEFVAAESLKRTVLAAHQIDALWYQFLSTPRSVSHLEIKHDLPCPEACWAASTASQWAHRQLVTKSSAKPVQYSEAVRQFLSPGSDLSLLPVFDPYGAINIAQFLISSARETSGWAAITGMISMERLEPLKASLLALGSVVQPERDRTTSMSAVLCEATWQTAMIELHMWSPSHTCGIVESSIDAVVKQSIDLTPSYAFLLETNAASSVQPHLNWFLRYLDSAMTPSSEPPWLTLYAYKALLIAWQLVLGGVAGAMQVVNIDDGDTRGALAWGKEVFGRRRPWQLGRLILSSLEALGTS